MTTVVVPFRGSDPKRRLDPVSDDLRTRLAEAMLGDVVDAALAVGRTFVVSPEPEPLPDGDIERLDKVGFNHVCFAVDDLEAEVARLRAHGVQMRNDVLDFHARKLIFLKGPEGITIELSEWR